MAAVPSMELIYDRRTVAVWTVLGAIITVTSVLAVMAGGVEALYLVVTGWIVSRLSQHWLIKSRTAESSCNPSSVSLT